MLEVVTICLVEVGKIGDFCLQQGNCRQDTDRVGFYTASAVRQGKSEPLAAFAVNPPALESDLGKLDTEAAATLRPKGVVEVTPGGAAPLNQTALWPYLALLLLGFLFLESFMVRRT